MRTLFLPVATLLLGLSAMAMPACAEGNVAIDDAGVEEDAGKPAPVPVVDAGVKETAAPTCVSQCSSDSECENSCAPVSTGANCCDTSTKKCYRNASACPVVEVDSGTSSGGY